MYGIAPDYGEARHARVRLLKLPQVFHYECSDRVLFVPTATSYPVPLDALGRIGRSLAAGGSCDDRANRRGGAGEDHVNFLPGRLGREDLKYLGEILVDFDLRSIQYPNMRDAAGERAGRLGLPSGARAAELRRMGGARATLEFALASRSDATAGRLLAERFGVPRVDVALPIGVAHTDQFFDALERLSGARRRGPMFGSGSR